MTKTAEMINAVKCEACGKLHALEADTYFSFHGNVCVGMHGGIIGNNLDDNDCVNRVSVYCRARKCLNTVFLEYVDWCDPESSWTPPEA